MTFAALCDYLRNVTTDIRAHNFKTGFPPQFNAEEYKKLVSQVSLQKIHTLFYDERKPGDRIFGNQIEDYAMKLQVSDCPYIKVKPHEGLNFPFTHRHEFIEINYMLTGSCVQTIEGTQYEMQPGDLLIFDTQTVHSVAVDDSSAVLIDIILLPDQAKQFLQPLLPDSSSLSVFVFQSASHLMLPPNHLLFHMGETQAFQDTMFHFLCECYFPRDRSDTTLLVSYLRTLFALLAQECALSPERIDCAYMPASKAGPIVRYIQEHCRDCTRESAAAAFGYTKAYISMLLKEYTGQTFLDLRNGFRLDAIHSAVELHPELSIRSLIEEYGFQNSSYFYRLYRERFGTTPKQA